MLLWLHLKFKRLATVFFLFAAKICIMKCAPRFRAKTTDGSKATTGENYGERGGEAADAELDIRDVSSRCLDSAFRALSTRPKKEKKITSRQVRHKIPKECYAATTGSASPGKPSKTQ